MNFLNALVMFLFVALPSAHAAQIKIEVNAGDRATTLEFKAIHEKYLMAISSNDFGKHETQIGETNFSYLEKRLKEISSFSSKKGKCERDLVEVMDWQNEAWVSRFQICLFDKTEQAESMRSLLNTLSIAY